MDNKSDKRPKVHFSAAKFKRLPMPEKLVYLREAFGALGNGLQVLERRHSPPRKAETLRPERESLFRGSGATPVASSSGMLSRAQFDQLTLENKLEYLAIAFRQLRQAARRTGHVPAEGEPQPPSTPVAK